MTQNKFQLDDKYTNGIWYDQMNGDYAKIRQEPGHGDIELINPDNGTVYWTIPVNEWVEREREDFRQISDEAVENPVAFLKEMIRKCFSELGGLNYDDQIAMQYAQEQVEIVEK